MKRLALIAAVIVLAACTAQKDDTAIDTTSPAMAPAPMMMDSVAIRDSIVRDSIRRDSIAKATKR